MNYFKGTEIKEIQDYEDVSRGFIRVLFLIYIIVIFLEFCK
jgi:hypothetical protein